MVKNHLPPSDGRGMPEGRGLAEGEKERSQPSALRATSFQRREKQQKPIYSPFIGKSVLQQVCL